MSQTGIEIGQALEKCWMTCKGKTLKPRLTMLFIKIDRQLVAVKSSKLLLPPIRLL